MKRLILQLNWTLHPLTQTGVNPSYNKQGKAIGMLDCIDDEDAAIKIEEFIKSNELHVLETKNGSASDQRERN